VCYALTDSPNLHHIFPLDFCEKHLGEQGQRVDSLLNIAYLTQIANLRISNRNLLEYLKDYIRDDFGIIQQTHLLPDVLLGWVQADEMPGNVLNTFIEARLELLLGCLRQYLSGITFEVIDTNPSQQTLTSAA
jgi:hypothetical protein